MTSREVPLFTIGNEENTLAFTHLKEALVGFVNQGASGLLFIKIMTEEKIFTREQLLEFESANSYPLIYTFNSASAELEDLSVRAERVEDLIDKILPLDGTGHAMLYVKHHLEIRDNKILLSRNEHGFLLTWTGITNDFNHYDDKAKPSKLYIQTPVVVKTYESVDQYYEVEYRNKL